MRRCVFCELEGSSLQSVSAVRHHIRDSCGGVRDLPGSCCVDTLPSSVPSLLLFLPEAGWALMPSGPPNSKPMRGSGAYDVNTKKVRPLCMRRSVVMGSCQPFSRSMTLASTFESSFNA